MSDSTRSRHSTLLLGLAFLLLLGLGSGAAWLIARGNLRGPFRVLLISPAPGAGSGLDAAQCRAIGALVQDHLEQLGGLAITSATSVPDDLESLRTHPHTLAILLEPSRQGESLTLTYRHAGAERPAGTPLAWVRHEAQSLSPSAAFDGFLRGFPRTLQTQGPRLCPQAPAAFWDLIQAGAWRLQNDHLDEAMALADRVAAREPDCASAWILVGNLRYRRMLNNPAAFRQEQAEAEALLQRGLELAPGHPRATFLLSLLKADSGNQADALNLLLQARRRQPHNPTLLTGVAYAARGAGLLPFSRRAMALRDELALAKIQPQAVDITCLYTGEIQRFEASLQEQPGHLRSTSGVLPFYRGYLALVRGDRALAQQEFAAAAALSRGYPNILRLSQIYGLILSGRKDEAWKKLREYDQERIGMREPDGEFTLRLAEAYAMLGDRASALDMAGRAFARGFGCTAWYERSPMLEPLRGLPKWKALLQHLRERQSLMEERFPIGLLEDN
jgi:hypothetical protein